MYCVKCTCPYIVMGAGYDLFLLTKRGLPKLFSQTSETSESLSRLRNWPARHDGRCVLGFPPLALVVPILGLIYGQMWRKDPSRSRWETGREMLRDELFPTGKEGPWVLEQVMNARVRMNIVPYWRERSMTFLVPDERKGKINRKWRSCCCSAYPFWAYPVYNNQWGVI